MNVSRAAEDILNNPRFEGAISTIKGITEWTDVGFATVITFVAFMIICVAMLKNVLAAAYCAYPKFWDQVNDAHNRKRDSNHQGVIQSVTGLFQNGLQGVTGGGASSQSVGDIIMGIIPDVKHMTDFEGGEFSAKHYFMKAIPQMLVCVALGAFIYNGTYRDVAALWVNTGTTLINRALLEFDPIAMFDDFTGTAGRPVFGSDNAVDQYTKAQNQIATDLYTAIIGTYTDIKSADQKRLLADACDREADRILKAMRTDGTASGSWGKIVVQEPGVSGDSSYSMRHSSSWASVDMSEQAAQRVGKVGDNPTQYQYAAVSSLTSMGISGISGETHPEHTFIVHVLQFTENAAVTTTGSATDLVLYIRMGDALPLPISNIGHTVWFSNNYSSGIVGVDKASISMSTNKDSTSLRDLNITDNTGLSVTGGVNNDGVYQLKTPLEVSYTTKDGVTEHHKIAYIKIVDSGVGTIKSPTIPDWGFSESDAPAQTYADALKNRGSQTDG